MKKATLTVPLLCLFSCCGEAIPPSASGFDEERAVMVRRQLEAKGREIQNARVLQAMGEVRRHEFVPKSQRAFAYLDRSLSIGYGQTISQPYIVAFMTEILEPKATDRVLEIGTGSGYQAAVLSKLVKEVYSVEIVKALAQRATATLKEGGYTNVTVKAGDGYQGWKEHAPFDAVIVTCAPDHVPPALVAQLKEGGKMIIPVGENGAVQHLYLLRKKAGKVVKESVLPVRFVPMTRD
jgi:protein-L-isoaspartate(D-aspartate) O-methyltransferase